MYILDTYFRYVICSTICMSCFKPPLLLNSPFSQRTFFSILQLVCFLLRCSASLRLSPAEASDRVRGGKTHLHALEISARVNLAPCSRLNIPHLLSACSLTSHTGLPPLTNQLLLRLQLFLSASKRRPTISVTGAPRGAYLAEEDIQPFK